MLSSETLIVVGLMIFACCIGAEDWVLKIASIVIGIVLMSIIIGTSVGNVEKVRNEVNYINKELDKYQEENEYIEYYLNGIVKEYASEKDIREYGSIVLSKRIPELRENILVYNIRRCYNENCEQIKKLKKQKKDKLEDSNYKDDKKVKKILKKILTKS